MVCLQTAISLQESCLPDSNEEPGGWGGRQKGKFETWNALADVEPFMFDKFVSMQNLFACFYISISA
jgi:hypothetical protein